MPPTKREPWNPLLCSYPDSRKVNAVSMEAETMFTRLIAKCDDHGNYDGCPRLLLSGLFARRFAAGELSDTDTLRMRNELVTAGLILLYRGGAETYLHIVNCKKSLRSDINPDIRFPDFAQPLTTQELPESVTEPLRERNETVAPIQSNPIQSNPEDCARKNARSSAKAPMEFDIFWSAYPRKVGKADALKAWKKIKKADALLPQMLDTIAAWRDSESWTKEGRKYCPHPAKWLKDGRWDDEPPAYEPDEFERAGLSRPVSYEEGCKLLGYPPIDESK